MMDESDARITNALAGKTFDHIERQGLELHIVTTCGHKITLASDTNYNIHMKKMGVTVMLPRVSLNGIAGKL